MLELSDSLTTEASEAAAAYRILESGLRTLARSSFGASLRQAFELRILEWAGYGLEFGHCRVCSTMTAAGSPPVFFVVARGGVVCARCRNSVPEGAIRIAAESAVALARLSTSAFDEAALARSAGRDGALAIARFISSILDRRLRSADFLDSMLDGR
jgi:DNA repair protein RecO